MSELPEPERTAQTALDDAGEPTSAGTGSTDSAWRLLLRNKASVVGIVVILVMVVLAIFGSFIAPYGANDIDVPNALQAPDFSHLFGTDDLGRDVLSRLLYGGQVTLLGVVQAMVVFLLLGTMLGLIAGMSRGAVDTVIVRLAEILLSVPSFIILLVMLSIVPGNMTVAMIALGILTSPLLIRVVRGTTRTVRNELFIRGARTMGLTETQITVRHVLPRLAGPIIVQATIFCGVVIIAETGLGYLGFGVQLPAPSWGNMVQTASENISRSPWLLIRPAARSSSRSRPPRSCA